MCNHKGMPADRSAFPAFFVHLFTRAFPRLPPALQPPAFSFLAEVHGTWTHLWGSRFHKEHNATSVCHAAQRTGPKNRVAGENMFVWPRVHVTRCYPRALPRLSWRSSPQSICSVRNFPWEMSVDAKLAPAFRHFCLLSVIVTDCRRVPQFKHAKTHASVYFHFEHHTR